MTDRTIREAICGCGALCVRTSGPPQRTMLCSCRSCQARSGSGVGISAYWPEDCATISGPSTTWRRDCQDGRHAEHHFCPTCGTTLWWRADFAPGLVGVAGGAFAEADFLEPTIAYWACDRPDWVSQIDQIKTVERQGT